MTEEIDKEKRRIISNIKFRLDDLRNIGINIATITINRYSNFHDPGYRYSVIMDKFIILFDVRCSRETQKKRYGLSFRNYRVF